MKYIMIGIVCVLLISLFSGCNKTPTCQINNTYYNTTIIQKHTIEKTIVPTNCTNNTSPINQTSRYILNLIKQLKNCESNIVSTWNLSECIDDLNNSRDEVEELEEDVERLDDKVDDLKDDIDDLEEDLDDC